MSHQNRPKARGPASRPRRQHRIESILMLEDRLVMAPVVANTVRTAVFTAAATPTNANLGTVSIVQTAATNSPAPVTSVSEFAANSEFGGDIVKIKAGPGGDFGKGLYAISRGAGSNTGAINKPGVIYRLDPATGKSSLFFDLNTVISQLEPGATAAASVGSSTGLVNWYDLAFDNEGYFDGKPSLFVSSADRSDPNKNVVYRIAPDGSFMGAYINFTAGSSAQKFTVNPTSLLVPPAQQQSFLRGLFVGNGAPNATTTTGTGTGTGTTATAAALPSSNFTGLFFNANAFRPGQDLSTSSLPTGVETTPFTFGPQVALTSANTDYTSPAYSAFTDFGSPGLPYDTGTTGGITGAPGLSGVQGVSGVGGPKSVSTGSGLGTVVTPGGELLIGPAPTTTGGTTTTAAPIIYNINAGLTPAQITALTTQATATTPSGVDQAAAISTPFRRFEDIAFDQYGYFSSNAPTATTTTTTATGDTLPYAGSLFVSDLATGLAVTATSVAIPAVPGTPATPTTPAVPGTPAIPATGIAIPVQGPGPVGVQVLPNGTLGPIVTNGNTTGGGNLGGRIIRIDPSGVVTNFATNFHTSAFQNSQGFIDSSLSITFSADGTTMYAADNDGIWQFKTVTSLAGSTSGSIVGLNDLRTLGVPYEGQNSAVAVVDTGVDSSPAFRGRVATGQNIIFNGPGNQDTAPAGTTTTGSTTTTGGFPDGHGTLVAGVVAQFVPQATLEPINVFTPATTPTTTTTTGTATTTTTASTSPQALYNGLKYTADHPFVADPIRPNTQDRVVAATLGFGTTQTFGTEVDALKKFPQVTLALKNQLHRLRTAGITAVAATGQFGAQATTTTGTTTGGTLGNLNGVALPAVFNEVISVTGTYPFPIEPSATTTPANSFVGLLGRLSVPFLLSSAVGGTTSTTTATTGLGALVANDGTIFAGKLLSTANRNITTDFAAPALDVPTFRRNIAITTTTTGTTTTNNSVTGNDPAHLVFQQGGTSLSAAIATGSFAVVASALDYWAALTPTGATTDAYLTQPVGVNSLNFGPHVLKDLNAYANPDGINSILQWTSVPTLDDPTTFADTTTTTTGGTTTTARATPHLLLHSTQPRAYSQISVGNAIAAIEGTIALDYLFKHNTFDIIDTNHNGLITAQEIQNFVDSATTEGLPEAGAMARLLGGNSRTPGSGTNGYSPDQPDVLQRRFNFFDYAANGSLKGVISIDALRQLSTKLLPQPGDFSIVDRQRSSAIRYLLSPSTARSTQDLQYIQPRAVFIPAAKIAKYQGFSPIRFGVGRNVNPLTSGPAISLYDGPTPTKSSIKVATPARTSPAPAATTAAPLPTTVTPKPATTTTTAATGTVKPISAPAVATAPTPIATVATPPAAITVPAASGGGVVPSTASGGAGVTSGVNSTSNTGVNAFNTGTSNTGVNALNSPKPAGDLQPGQPTPAATSPTARQQAREARIAEHQARVEAYHAKLAAFHAAHPNASKPDSQNAFEKFFNNLGIPLFKKKK